MVKNFLVFILLLTLSSCENEDKNTPIKQPNKWTQEHSTKFAKEVSREEERDIKVFLKNRPNWDIKKSETGLRYWIYEKTENPAVEPGQTISVSFEVKLLNGKVCYETEDGSYSTFMVDKSDVETGVQEAVKYMREGEKAKLIIPSHIGHGLLGDFDKIPPMQPLVIDLHIKNSN